MLPAPLLKHLEKILSTGISGQTRISGGDIHQTWKLNTASGQSLFLKHNNGPQAAEMFRTEALGLSLLGASGVIAVPKVLGFGNVDGRYAYLLMVFINPGHRNRLFWEDFGVRLAKLHSNTSQHFGFAHDNFIGALPQSNRRRPDWPSFFTHERLEPQMRMAREKGLLEAPDAQALERLCAKISRICPAEPSALTHGDLWGGNFLCNTEGQPVLIDPAACFAHREMDLAMSRLFGGFDPAFYHAYNEYWPLEPGFEDRLEIYQLYYLLVHVNLFGGAYTQQVRDILKRF